MKRLFITALLFPYYLTMGESTASHSFMKAITAKVQYIERYEKFVTALTWVESRERTWEIGGDMACGKFQITPILLEDYNRRTGQRYELADLFNDSIARAIFDYYSIGKDFEVAARCWNGGPRGMKKQSTVCYWQKVNQKMNEL
jgi:hypothetical protein